MNSWIYRYCILFFFVFVSFTNSENPFNYDLHISRIPGTSGKTWVCMHGKGGDYTIGYNVKEASLTKDTIISFNFPDYGIRSGQKKLEEISYGTIDEILPAIYVLKKLIIDEGQNQINLYGFSAGGGALINLLGVLNSEAHDKSLKKIGVHQKEKEKILQVIQKGNIILDTPLKSVREIVSYRGSESGLVPFEKRYRENGMEPIDALQGLDNLSLNIWVHFQKPDEVLSNRDDDIYIERLKKYNSLGQTRAIIGFDAGHKVPHPTLWKAYMQENEKQSLEKKERKYIIGIKTRTSNAECQQDIPLLWERFRKENICDRVSHKLNENIYVVYFDYEKDFTRPYSYLIGYEVSNLNQIPQGLCGVVIEEGPYLSYDVEGFFPNSLMNVWHSVWQTDLSRAYHTDYEFYPSGFNKEDSKGLVLNIGIKP